MRGFRGFFGVLISVLLFPGFCFSSEAENDTGPGLEFLNSTERETIENGQPVIWTFSSAGSRGAQSILKFRTFQKVDLPTDRLGAALFAYHRHDELLPELIAGIKTKEEAGGSNPGRVVYLIPIEKFGFNLPIPLLIALEAPRDFPGIVFHFNMNPNPLIPMLKGKIWIRPFRGSQSSLVVFDFFLELGEIMAAFVEPGYVKNTIRVIFSELALRLERLDAAFWKKEHQAFTEELNRLGKGTTSPAAAQAGESENAAMNHAVVFAQRESLRLLHRYLQVEPALSLPLRDLLKSLDRRARDWFIKSQREKGLEAARDLGLATFSGLAAFLVPRGFFPGGGRSLSATSRAFSLGSAAGFSIRGINRASNFLSAENEARFWHQLKGVSFSSEVFPCQIVETVEYVLGLSREERTLWVISVSNRSFQTVGEAVHFALRMKDQKGEALISPESARAWDALEDLLGLRGGMARMGMPFIEPRQILEFHLQLINGLREAANELIKFNTDLERVFQLEKTQKTLEMIRALTGARFANR